MDAGRLLVNKYEICGFMQVLEYLLKVKHELCLWYELDPLDKNVDVPTLEKDILPLCLLNHIKHEADVEALVFGGFVVLMDLAEHADD